MYNKYEHFTEEQLEGIRKIHMEYLAGKERIILELCRKHGFQDYEHMRHRGYDIQSEVQQIPTENGYTTKETFTVYKMQKIDQVTIELKAIYNY